MFETNRFARHLLHKAFIAVIVLLACLTNLIREPIAVVHAKDAEAWKLMMKAGFLAYDGDYVLAEKLYHQSLDIEPMMPTFAGLGDLLIAMGKPEEGLEMANKALEMNPYHFMPYGVLARAYMELGDIQKAKESARVWYDRVRRSGTMINKNRLNLYDILMKQ